MLLTLQIRTHERRLDDFLGWWAGTGAGLLSVQRIFNLLDSFPKPASAELGGFARLASAAGDCRWKRHAHASEDPPLKPRTGKGTDTLTLHAPPALLLRLRAGLGVGAEADLLTLLLGLHGERVTTKEAAKALGYTEVAVRTAAQDMALAGFVEETLERPVRYAARGEPWVAVLHPSSGDITRIPRWRYWAGLFPLLADTQRWAQEGRAGEWSPYVWSSRARDVLERHQRTLDMVRLQTPIHGHHRGTDVLPAFVDTTEQVAEWILVSL
ncbi:MAG: MarR family transcriptional regulator [Rhodothermales bacterium]